jgi:hypothetical protein
MFNVVDVFTAHADAIGGGLAAVAGATGLLLAWRERVLARATLAWPSVMGTIKQSRPSYVTMGGGRGGDTARHELFVQYAYRVGDREYTANRTSFGDEPFGTYEEIAADAARRLPPGARVQVFYDPTDPRRAVLERGQPRGDSRWVLFSLVFLIAGVWLCGRAFFTQ